MRYFLTALRSENFNGGVNVSKIIGMDGKWRIDENGNFTVETVTAKKARFNELEMVDKATGEIYCTRIEQGEWIKTKGECGQALQNFGNQNLSGQAIEQPAEEPPPNQEQSSGTRQAAEELTENSSPSPEQEAVSELEPDESPLESSDEGPAGETSSPNGAGLTGQAESEPEPPSE